MPFHRSISVLLFGVALGLANTAIAQTCSYRGQLDEIYCDENHDLVADVPAKTRDPSVLVFAYTPVEDPAVYENAFKPFTEYLGKCTGKRVVYYPVQSNSAEIEAMRSGRLHVAGFSTGPVGFAVNMAGAVPFAGKGTRKASRATISSSSSKRRALIRSCPTFGASVSHIPPRLPIPAGSHLRFCSQSKD